MLKKIKSRFVKYFVYKFFVIKKYIKYESPKILDIGAGNHSATRTKEVFPNCEYHGVDRDKDYSNSDSDLKKMDYFYEMDLQKLDFQAIPDNYFDVIIIAHVIEHLKNGDTVIEKLTEKLSPNGIIYVEWPSIRSIKLPSKRGTLNFFDDITHVKLYSLEEICNICLSKNLTFLEGGIRRSKRLIFLIPVKMLDQKLRKGYVEAETFWDLLGFADYCVFRK